MNKLVTIDPSGTEIKTETEYVTIKETVTVKETDSGPWIIMLGVSIILLILLIIICAYAANLHFKKHENRPLPQREQDERQRTDLVPNTEMEMGMKSPLTITPPPTGGNNMQGDIEYGSD